MSRLENELLLRISHLDGEKQNAVLDYIRNMDGRRHSVNKHRRSAMRQIRQALERLD